MSKRVTNIVVENCTLTVSFSDCTTMVYDISNCGDKTPETKNPGDWPPPDPVADVVCRVAIKVGQQAAERLDNYLSGLNLVDPFLNLPAFYTSGKIAEYGWSISLYNAMINFYHDVITGSPTAGKEAADDWDANSAAIIAAVQEALYCVLPSSGEITDATRQIWALALDGIGTPFMSLLSDLLLIWPLAQLREMAFNASTTTDAVSCAAFDCGGGGGISQPCPTALFDWSGIGATPGTWAAEPAGQLDTSTWTGDTLDFRPDEPIITLETTTRNPNDDWRATGAISPGGQNLRYMAIRYTPETPCVVTHVDWGSGSNSGGGSKMMAVAAQLEGGQWTVLKSDLFGVGSTDAPGQNWTGSPVTVTALMFITGHYRGTGPVSIQIRNNNINV